MEDLKIKKVEKLMEKDGIKRPLRSWLDEFYEDTGKLSEILRNLCFAGIGLIWIFKNSDNAEHLLPSLLVTPLRFIVLSLAADVMQYIWRAVNIYIHYKILDSKHINKKISDEAIEDVIMPDYIPLGTWIFFIGKLVLIIIAYLQIYSFLSSKL
jgi:hypothetical protein